MLESLQDMQFWVAAAGVAAVVLQTTLTVGVILRVILTRHPPGSSFAWILLTVILPFVGFVLYLWLGEKPIGKWRARKLRHILGSWEELAKNSRRVHEVPPEKLPAGMRHRGMMMLAQRLGKMPVTMGSNLKLIAESEQALASILQDVEAAKNSVSMEFYIWGCGGWSDRICEALVRAAERGIHVRVLVDDIGSRQWLRTTWPARLMASGAHVSRALPVNIMPLSKGRTDLRLHRKTVVIDDVIGYTGSLNLIDPAIFNAHEGVGEWIDAMVRVTGTVVRDLNQVFELDWALQPDDEGRKIDIKAAPEVGRTGEAYVTCVPSGPTTMNDLNKRLVLEAIGCARERIFITTPYFIPGETIVLALQNAAMRGVDVRICVPNQPDSKFVRWASRRYFSDLMDSGVKILSFTGGLLHTKAITVDNAFSLFGTMNLDKRSLHLNFEMMLLIYDKTFVEDMTALHLKYEAGATAIDPVRWHKRTLSKRFLEGLCYLISPLL